MYYIYIEKLWDKNKEKLMVILSREKWGKYYKKI